MEFVALLKFRPSVSAAERDAALMRRAGWQFPDGLKVIAEYWPLSGEYQVVTFSPSGYCQPARRIRAASRSAAGTEGRNFKRATNSMTTTFPTSERQENRRR